MFIKTDEYSKCIKCGKPSGRKYMIIATGYIEPRLFRKESVETVKTVCMDCGKDELFDLLQSLECPIWIGMPSVDAIRGKRNAAINFRPQIID